MRRAPIVLSAAFAVVVSMSAVVSPAQAQGCTGPECSQQGQGGQQCHKEKKEEVTS